MKERRAMSVRGPITQLGRFLNAARELLAVIHRDGGQHTEEVGFEQSCEDAMEIAAELLTRSEASTDALAEATKAFKDVLDQLDGTCEFHGPYRRGETTGCCMHRFQKRLLSRHEQAKR
jgi:hypothetical protein